jgi:hypothetical protein
MDRRPLLASFALAVLLGIGVAAWRWLAPAATYDASPSTPPADAAAVPPPGGSASEASPPLEAGSADADAAPDLVGRSWVGVDLEEVRAALPENLYWEKAAPTLDERLVRQREEDKARRNELYGKVLSGTGSEEEIRAYFEERQRLSTDYIQFVDYLLEHYEDRLPEQDLGLLHLARKLHLARLQEIPRRLQGAFDRKRAQDAARAAWLADEEAFDADPPPENRD